MKSIIFLVLFVGGFAVAAVEDPKSREAISEKARGRLYDGGADEQPLVVQPSLVEPRSDGSETSLQRKLLNSEEGGEAEAVDETSSGF
jgi:hypothetical protein